MSVFYSASNRAFFVSELTPVDLMPEDRKAISESRYRELMDAQANGQIIRSRSDGFPEAVPQSDKIADGFLFDHKVEMPKGATTKKPGAESDDATVPTTAFVKDWTARLGIGGAKGTAIRVSDVTDRNDCNDITASGIYSCVGASNAPAASILIHTERRFGDGISAAQLSFTDVGSLCFRTKIGDVWNAWQTVQADSSTGNFLRVDGRNSMAAPILSTLAAQTWLNAARGKSLIGSSLSGGEFVPLFNYVTRSGGSFVVSGYDRALQMAYLSDLSKRNGSNVPEWTLTIADEQGNASLPASLSVHGSASVASLTSIGAISGTNGAFSGAISFDSFRGRSGNLTGQLTVDALSARAITVSAGGSFGGALSANSMTAVQTIKGRDINALNELSGVSLRVSVTATVGNLISRDSIEGPNIRATSSMSAPTMFQGCRTRDVATTEFVQNELDAFDAIPAGMVAPFAGECKSKNWLLCDGRQVSRSQYPKLFAALGTRHGAGNGSTTFNLPNYSGRFLEGANGSGEVGQLREAAVDMTDHYHVTGNFGGNNGGEHLIDKNSARQARTDRVTAARWWNGSGGWQGQRDAINNYSGNQITSLQVGGEVRTVRPRSAVVEWYVHI